MTMKELGETQRKEVSTLETKFKEKLEILQADQASRRKELQNTSSEEKNLLKKEFEEEAKEIDRRYPRVPVAEQAAMAKKIEELLSKT